MEGNGAEDHAPGECLICDNNRLRAEVERLTEANRNLHASYCHSQEQFVASEQEGNRLRAEVDSLTSTVLVQDTAMVRLRAEVERLREALMRAAGTCFHENAVHMMRSDPNHFVNVALRTKD